MGEAASWATAIGTIVLAIVAVFQDKIRNWLTRPKLQLEVRASAPDCHATVWRHAVSMYDPNTGQPSHQVLVELPCYYFRFRVTNEGNCEAREVEIFAKELKRHDDLKGEFEEVTAFTPMNLLWSNVRVPFLSVLSPQIPKHCDFAHVVRPDQKTVLRHELAGVRKEQCVLALDLQVEPNSGGHLIGPGYYRLSLVLAAANAPPREYVIDVRITGDWYDDEERMFGEAVRLHLR